MRMNWPTNWDRALWFAEHHNTTSLARSATAILIGRAASRTERIQGRRRSWYQSHPVIAELRNACQHVRRPDRSGPWSRAGTDQMTQMLNRTSADPQSFATAIFRMQGWFSDQGAPDSFRLAPLSAGMNVPMWVLGSTVNGARLPRARPAFLDRLALRTRLDDAIAPIAQLQPRCATAQMTSHA